MSFSSMPPEILDMILNQTGIPLPERILLRAVSPHFRDTIQDGLQRETSLTIHVDVNYEKHQLELTQDDWIIKKDRFNTKCTQFIGRLFPQVTQLTLYSDSLVFWRKASQLIDIYFGQLQTLKVDGYLSKTKNRETVLISLAGAVNSIATLTSLNLQMNSKSNVGYHLLPRLEGTLSRLNRFICSGDLFGDLMEHNALFISTSLASACTHLQLDESNGLLLAQLAPNLTHLHLMDCWDTVLSDIPSFHRLSSLTLFFESYPTFDSSFLQQLRPLVNLTELHLLDMFFAPLELPPTKAEALSHIKRLTLQIFPPYAGNFDWALFLHALAVWFPYLSDFNLYCNRNFHEKIQANLDGLSFTVKIHDESVDGKLSFWK